MSRLHATRPLFLAVVGAALLALTASIGFGLTGQRPTNDSFWAGLRTEGIETSYFQTLGELLRASDAVVVAKVSGVDVSRAIQGDNPSDVVTYARVTLEVVHVIAGDSPATVPLEFIVGATPDQAAAEIQNLRQWIPGGTSVYFLHEKQGKGERGLYRLTNTTGLWSATTRAKLDAPLQEEPPESSGLYASELNSLATVDGLVDLLAGYAARP